jgi:hypothetical protein
LYKYHINCLFLFLGFELGALYLWGRCSTNWATPAEIGSHFLPRPSCTMIFLFSHLYWDDRCTPPRHWDWVSQTFWFCLCSPGAMILQISTFWAASYRCETLAPRYIISILISFSLLRISYLYIKNVFWQLKIYGRVGKKKHTHT